MTPTFVGVGVRTGLGTDDRAQAAHSMRWHREQSLWVSSQSRASHWQPGMTVIAAQSGAGSGMFMRGVALDADTPDYDPTIEGWLPTWHYAKRVAWEPQTFFVPRSAMCPQIKRLLRVRSLWWLEYDDLGEILASLKARP
jgi:hypothetical protein